MNLTLLLVFFLTSWFRLLRRKPSLSILKKKLLYILLKFINHYSFPLAPSHVGK